ncbi:MAG: M42 family metallopeptidase [Syntrophothermus sp.]
MDETVQLFKELTDASGVSGYEREVRAIMRKHLEPMAVIEADRLGSLIARKDGAAGSPRIMLAAHMDEIGFMVKQITEDGFLRFSALGGWWEQVMLAQRVRVKTAKGDYIGVIGSLPPHILTEEARKKVVEKKDMFIDIGASSEKEATEELGVRPGDPIIPVSDFATLGDGRRYLAKAWDDRLGCAMIIDLFRRLAGVSHPNTIYGVGTVQEEVGLRGAQTSAQTVDPDVGIALDVGVAADTPGMEKEKVMERLGKGPVLLILDHSLIPNLRLRDLIVDTAKEAGLPLQFDVMEGGATDAGKIQFNQRGVASVVLAMPTRYIHSHAGIISRDDYDHAVELLLRVLQKLDARTVESFYE